MSDTEATDAAAGTAVSGRSGASPEDREGVETHDSDIERAAKHTPSSIPLRVEGLRKEFGSITAVDGASFSVEKGSITGLIGPNGAGKSTTFNCITGIHEPTDGTVYFQGEDVTGLSPNRIANHGLVRTFQLARELEEMTVIENMMLAPKGQLGESLWRSVLPLARRGVVEQERKVLERCWEMLEFFEIDHLAEEYAGNLSGGQRKLLELARALLTDPTMLLLDEPFAGVNPSLEGRLLEHIHELREDGYTFLIVEHDMDLIMEHCEHIIVMHQGSVLTEGPPSEVRSNEAVIEAYLGGDVE
ncbi:ABC-type transport system ATP-binding protein (probable substrate branched-chain amino acids) [Natronomonas moolapensis 8.8.11]|uniref:Probable branched-chain amino acid transport ATP-binding protein LivG n=1 Tax=Natronomonas moolapensis (strain DSM 18674 / CECT 7526 / JCM 14361 / 8.8.11) TaxID=268739 RepID=M1XR21_NATM8|nr:ABC transporter ATP-binding protein [Natronomonas moolapensis]CCQ36591.1 ABC-type transport system ATP-binding protein (probable substrate branched-chain amino acids) [Natronomonas moolapensis 8.8.11]